MKTKRKVGKSCGDCRYLWFKGMRENLYGKVRRWTCYYDKNKKACKHFMPKIVRKPKQEEKIVYYCPVDSAYRDFVCGDKEGIAKCTAKKYIIFKECNQPFKLIKVEGR